MASFSVHFFIFRENQASISMLEVLPSGCDMYYTPDGQLFLQPHIAPRREDGRFSTVSMPSARTSLGVWQLGNHCNPGVITHNKVIVSREKISVFIFKKLAIMVS
jgi:hypothetical protein